MPLIIGAREREVCDRWSSPSSSSPQSRPLLLFIRFPKEGRRCKSDLIFPPHEYTRPPANCSIFLPDQDLRAPLRTLSLASTQFPTLHTYSLSTTFLLTAKKSSDTVAKNLYRFPFGRLSATPSTEERRQTQRYKTSRPSTSPRGGITV